SHDELFVRALGKPLQPGDAADGQERDVRRVDAEPFGGQRVTELVQQHRAENAQDESQALDHRGPPAHEVVAHREPEQKEQEGDVEPDGDARHFSHVERPAHALDLLVGPGGFGPGDWPAWPAAHTVPVRAPTAGAASERRRRGQRPTAAAPPQRTRGGRCCFPRKNRPIMMNTTASITTGSKSQTRKLVPKSTTRSPMPTRAQPMADWSRSGPDERRAPKSPPCPPRVVPDERGPPMSPSVSPSTVSDAAALYALPPGSSGPTIHAMMYSTTPAPPHSTVSSHASRTMVGSMLKYSATPAATPPKMRSCRERYKRLGALAAIGIASCIPRPGSGSAAAVPKTG